MLRIRTDMVNMAASLMRAHKDSVAADRKVLRMLNKLA